MGCDRWCRVLCFFISLTFVLVSFPFVKRADSEEIVYEKIYNWNLPNVYFLYSS